MTLSERDQAMLDGVHGAAPQLAMSILVRMADVYGAPALMDISQAHIDSTIYLGDATLEFAERLASLGARVAVPTSLNVSGVDACGWQQWAVTPEWAAKAARQMLAYEKMGAVTTWTCAPYHTHMRPVFGQQIAGRKSNTIAFANSVIGARNERYPTCSIFAARLPAACRYRPPPHRASRQDRCRAPRHVPRALQEDDRFFAVFGHLVGTMAEDAIPSSTASSCSRWRISSGVRRGRGFVGPRRAVPHGPHHARSADPRRSVSRSFPTRDEERHGRRTVCRAPRADDDGRRELDMVISAARVLGRRVHASRRSSPAGCAIRA